MVSKFWFFKAVLHAIACLWETKCLWDIDKDSHAIFISIDIYIYPFDGSFVFVLFIACLCRKVWPKSLFLRKLNAKLALFTDASNHNIATALQREDNGWKSLAFFSKKLSTADAKYSAFDRELLSIYLAIKHFQYILEPRTFVIYTDHKPLIFTFR